MAKIDPRVQIYGRQLKVEMVRAGYRSTKQLADALNAAGIKTDYTTLTKRMSGAADLDGKTLLPILDFLNVDFFTFLREAADTFGPPED